MICNTIVFQNLRKQTNFPKKLLKNNVVHITTFTTNKTTCNILIMNNMRIVFMYLMYIFATQNNEI
jgi:hypothetical protein